MHRTIRQEKSGFVHYKKNPQKPWQQQQQEGGSKSAADGEVWRHGHDACTEKLLFVRHLSCNSIGYWFHTINCLPSVFSLPFFFNFSLVLSLVSLAGYRLLICNIKGESTVFCCWPYSKVWQLRLHTRQNCCPPPHSFLPSRPELSPVISLRLWYPDVIPRSLPCMYPGVVVYPCWCLFKNRLFKRPHSFGEVREVCVLLFSFLCLGTWK